MKAPASAPFREVGIVVAGQHVEAALYNRNGNGTPYLTGPDDFGPTNPTVSKWTDSPKVFAAETDVLLTVKGAGVGKSNLGINAAIGRQLMALRPDSAMLDRRFLFRFLQSCESHLARLGQGATVPGIAKPAIENLLIPLLPLHEQQRIADILDKADAIRRKRREQLATLLTLEVSIFHEMFGGAADLRQWPIIQLARLIQGDPQNGLYRPSSDYGDGTLILRIDSFYDGEITNLAGLKRVRLDEQLIKQYQLAENEIVINRVNSREFLGKSAIIPRLDEPVVYESNMMRLRPDAEKINPRYLIAVLQTQFIRIQIQRRTRDAVNQASINQADVLGFEIPVPPRLAQDQFVRRVLGVHGLRQRVEPTVPITDALFDSLVQRAFRGEL